MAKHRDSRHKESMDEKEGNIHEYTVSELSFALKCTVEERYPYVRVRGELGRVSRPASGHVYLDLKDEKCVINGVIWKGVAARLGVKPEQGLEVIATGKLTTFPGQSRYQIVIERMEPAGVGALMALLEARKKKLAAEGLFAPEAKLPIPFLPRVIGVVTSPSGAVIRDILHRLSDRFPTRVLVWPVRVQGESCAAEVAAGIAGFNAFEPSGALPRPDLIIVARGGGSLEDLWGFNEEEVVRAAALSKIPLISAVGHETDWTLIDYAADERAPTPTAAAERAVPVRADLVFTVDDLERRLALSLNRLGKDRRTALTSALRALPLAPDLLAMPRQRLDSVSLGIGHALRARLALHRGRFERQAGRVSLGPLAERLKLQSARNTELGERMRQAVMRLQENLRQSLTVQLKLGDLLTTQHQRLTTTSQNMDFALRANLTIHRGRYDRLAGRVSLGPFTERLKLQGARNSELGERMRQAAMRFCGQCGQKLEAQAKLLASLGYKNVLLRGYALVRNSQGGMIRTAKAISSGDMLEIEFSDGRMKAQAGTGAKPRGKKRKTPPPQDQGRLL